CYLNEIYLGHVGSVAIYGVGEAAQRYFGKPIEAVSIEEAALLAGLIKGPNLFSPIRAPELAKARRDLVLHRLHETGALSSDEWTDAVGQPVTVVSPEQSLAEAPYFVDYLLHQSKEASDNSFPQGTRLYTTLDPILQRLASDAVETGLSRLERQYPALKQNEAELQAALVALDANTGGILAMIGGRRYGGSQFNRAVQARRQPGSLFKPFVYLAAFEAEEDSEGHRITPATLVLDMPVEFQAGHASWSPENYDHQFRGQVTVRAALEQSLNVPAVRVAQATGLARVTEVAGRLGLPPSGEEHLSLALGTAEVTLLDITAAFGTLARQGLYVPPTGLRTAQLPTGLTMSRAWPERHLAVSPQSAYLVTTLLKGVVEQGTAAEARTLGLEGIVAGKTGTTDSYRDAWFVGYTPDITIGVWVGYDDGRPLRLTGSQAALPIWVAFAKQVIPPDSPDFPVPSGIVTRNIDPGTGYLANAGCPEAIQEAFIAGTEPTEYCPVHRGSFWERIRETLGL
ncbi:MAG: penicillin-binding transpeptidase domain-containing protein, partial [Nitrospirales bacterium]